MKKKVLFVNDEMVIGGVAKVLNNLFQHLDYDKVEVDLLVLHARGEMLKEIPPQVNLIQGAPFFEVCDLPLSECLHSKQLKLIVKKLYLIFLMKSGLIEKKIQKERKRMLMKEYDIEIAFKEGFCSIFTACGNTKKKINWIHVDYKVMNYSSNYTSLLKRLLPRFDEQVAVSEVAAKSYQEVFELGNPVQVVHNFIQDEIIKQKSNEVVNYRDETFSFVSVGRLHAQKGYDRLIRCHAQLIQQGIKFKTYIIGGGELESELKELIASLYVEDSFFLLGNQFNPYPYIKQADCFVLSSLYEGLPTVVYESLICGTPVLACLTAGVKEQITEGLGLIVENSEEGLLKGMEIILNNPKELEKMKENCFVYRYCNDKIERQVEELLEV